MSHVRFRIAMSLDGYAAGPDQSLEHPLGVGGDRLHDWMVANAAARAMWGEEGGEVDASTPVIEETYANLGATVMGRNMFGGYPGPWNTEMPWRGWWGDNPPYHHPVFVLTNYPRDPLPMEGGTTFNFVTDGIETALEQAKEAAGDKVVSLAGGANVANQYLAAGLVDEMEIHLVPILLGSGERMFEGVTDDQHGLTLVRTVAAPGVTHLKFERV